MKEFIDQLAKTRAASQARADELSLKHGIKVTDTPINGLSMCFNHLTVALELTSHYEAAWNGRSTDGMSAEKIKILRDQNGERLVLLSKTAFVWSLSAIEFCMKTAIKHRPGVIVVKKPRPYIADIIGACDETIVPKEDRAAWISANKIRNRVVHNNGVGQAAEVHRFPAEDIKEELDMMVTGSILTFPRILDWLIGAYARLCDGFISASASAGHAKAP